MTKQPPTGDYSGLLGAILDCGVDDYRQTIRRCIKIKEVDTEAQRMLKELDEDMPPWLDMVDTLMTWEDIKEIVRKQEVERYERKK